MPTVFYDGPYAFRFYSADQVEPPHIHVQRDRDSAKFWLDPVQNSWRRGMTTLVLERDPIAVAVDVTDEHFSIHLADGRIITAPLEWYPRLAHATAAERNHYELLGHGSAIGWPDLDEHLSVESILAGRSSGESQRSFQRWLSSRQNTSD